MTSLQLYKEIVRRLDNLKKEEQNLASFLKQEVAWPYEHYNEQKIREFTIELKIRIANEILDAKEL